MQCVDCHNRAAHSFEMADRAVDGAIASGQIPADLPFVKKTGLALIQAQYASAEEAYVENRRATERFLSPEISRCFREAIQRRERSLARARRDLSAATCFPI